MDASSDFATRSDRRRQTVPENLRVILRSLAKRILSNGPGRWWPAQSSTFCRPRGPERGRSAFESISLCAWKCMQKRVAVGGRSQSAKINSTECCCMKLRSPAAIETTSPNRADDQFLEDDPHAISARSDRTRTFKKFSFTRNITALRNGLFTGRLPRHSVPRLRPGLSLRDRWWTFATTSG